MTPGVLHLEPDSVTNSAASEDHPHEEESLSADPYWMAFAEEQRCPESKLSSIQIPLGFRVAITETSTVGTIGPVEGKILAGYTHPSWQTMSEVLLSYTTACRLLANTIQENLFEVSGSWADVATSLRQQTENIAQAFCSTAYLREIRNQQKDRKPVSQEIIGFLTKKAPDILPNEILSTIGMLAQQSFPHLVDYSFNIVEDPELREEERICLEIHSRGAVEEVSLQYDSFIDSLIEACPFQVRRWFVFDINLI